MKELSIEQKARAYDEAKYIMKEYLESGNAGVIAENTIRKAFPELKESEEDEKIRKSIINLVIKSAQNGGMALHKWESQQMIAWLEKQGEKPTDTDSKFTGMREIKPKDISEFLDRLTTVEQEFLWEHIAKIRELDKEEQKHEQGKLGEMIKNLKPLNEVLEQKPADSYCQENCKGFQETGKCFADGECKAKREAEQEEDEEILDGIITDVEVLKEQDKTKRVAANRRNGR